MNESPLTIGSRGQDTQRDPAACHRRAVRLIGQLDKLNPHPRPRGFVFKARTWREYEDWRKRQKNPRLW